MSGMSRSAFGAYRRRRSQVVKDEIITVFIAGHAKHCGKQHNN
jgi:hypothetical protein